MARKKTQSNNKKAQVGIFKHEHKLRKIIVGGSIALVLLLIGAWGYSAVKGYRIKAQAENWTYIGTGYSGGAWHAYACKMHQGGSTYYVRVLVTKGGWTPTYTRHALVNNVPGYPYSARYGLLGPGWTHGGWFWYQVRDIGPLHTSGLFGVSAGNLPEVGWSQAYAYVSNVNNC